MKPGLLHKLRRAQSLPHRRALRERARAMEMGPVFSVAKRRQERALMRTAEKKKTNERANVGKRNKQAHKMGDITLLRFCMV